MYYGSVADPDPQDPNHFAGSGSRSGSEIIVSDPDPVPKGTF